MKKYMLLLPLLVLVGCEERYRYPCQDPVNWEQEYCKKPFCSANGTCPEDLRHYEKDKNSIAIPATQNNFSPAMKKGECK
jgi:endogenous inhibitor of DNA gyrase (YacG/DUF329 family)